MKVNLSMLIAFLLPVYVFAQSNDIVLMHENAKRYMNQGDYSNATLILSQLHREAPYITDISKDLALGYYMQGQYDEALKTLDPLLSKKNPDEVAFQYAGMIDKKAGRFKDAEKIYKRGLKSFPKSGPLYNSYGEFLWSQGDMTAINQWENGIKNAPEYPDNYLNATRYYFASTSSIWSVIYGEMFLNLEPDSVRSDEMKSILVGSYKKLFSQLSLSPDTKTKSKFESAYLNIIKDYSDIVARGVTPETLTMVRTRFILDWFRKGNGEKFPFLLFSRQKFMLENGLFSAYNQWLFNSSEAKGVLKNWVDLHGDEYDAFRKYMKDNKFVVPDGQYYH